MANQRAQDKKKMKLRAEQDENEVDWLYSYDARSTIDSEFKLQQNTSVNMEVHVDRICSPNVPRSNGDTKHQA